MGKGKSLKYQPDNEDLNYSFAYKDLTDNSYTITSFELNKQYDINLVSWSTSPYNVVGLRAYRDTSNAIPIVTSSYALSEVTNINGPTTASYYKAPTHLNWLWLKNNYYQHEILHDKPVIIGIPQKNIGQGIKKESFSYGGFCAGVVNLISDRPVFGTNYGDLIDTTIDTSGYLPTSNLIGHYGFEEEQARLKTLSKVKLTDQSQNKNHGIGYDCYFLEGVITSGSFASGSGNACTFINTSSYGEIPYSENQNLYDRMNWTVSMWLRLPPTQYNTNTEEKVIFTKKTPNYRLNPNTRLGQTNFSKGDSLPAQYPIEVGIYATGSNAHKIYANVSDGFRTLNLVTTQTFNDLVWRHIGVVKSGSIIQLYGNGILQASGSISGFKRTWNDSPYLIANGSSSDFSGASLLGMDELRIYNTFATPTQIGYLSNNAPNGDMYQTNKVGKIFYDSGLIIINSPQPRYSNVLVGENYNYSSGRGFIASWKATKRLKEHSIDCTMLAHEFNYTQNTTARINNDPNLPYLKDFATGSNFSPYISTIGLYNSKNQLMATAKLSQPIKKPKDMDITFNVKFDTPEL